MTAVTLQSNKIVSNEVKDKLALPESSYGKNKKQETKGTLWPSQYPCSSLLPWLSWDLPVGQWRDTGGSGSWHRAGTHFHQRQIMRSLCQKLLLKSLWKEMCYTNKWSSKERLASETQPVCAGRRRPSESRPQSCPVSWLAHPPQSLCEATLWFWQRNGLVFGFIILILL